MPSIKEQIKTLNDKLTEYQQTLETIETEIKLLKGKAEIDQATILRQEKEIKDFESKLFECSKERGEIQQTLNDKIIKLENSNLTKEQIKDKVIKLLTENNFSEVSKKLIINWANYAKSKDVFVEVLKKRDQHAYEAINSINDTKKNQWRIIWGLLILVVLLSLSLSLSLLLQAKKGESKVKSNYK